MDAAAIIVNVAITLWTLYEVGRCIKRNGFRNILRNTHLVGTRP